MLAPRVLNLTMENIENNDVLKAEIKSILAFKAKDGATYKDVKGKLTGNSYIRP